MNRRKFFGMTFAGVAAAGLPAIVLPERTHFLAPQFGWKPSELGQGYMRELSQYLINIDEFRYRYDAIGRDIWGKEHQFHVQCAHPMPDVASKVITDRFRHDGLIAIPPHKSREFRLILPRGLPVARYI